MLLIACPHCGSRAQTEFTYRGDATVERPVDPDAVSVTEWLDYVYIRDNPKGEHLEWWQHSAGCRRFIKIRRNTITHEILDAAKAGGPL